MKAKSCILVLLLLQVVAYSQDQPLQPVFLKNVRVIDGSGNAPQENVNVLLDGEKFKSIGEQVEPSGARVIDLTGKTIMPLITNVHGHLGMSKGTTVGSQNFTHDQILKELKRYESYGVGTILSMGTDKELIFSIRDASRSGSIGGATVFTAGFGFRPPLGSRPQETGMEKLYRPSTAAEAEENVRSLAAFKPDVVKMWIDAEKIKPEVYRAIISESHKHGIRVAAHLFYLEDAHSLVDAGVDFFAHSVRDKEVDDALIKKMKEKGVIYIPTLTRDAYEFFYGTAQPWINDPFFKASLEPGVFEMVTSEEYKKNMVNSPRYQFNKDAYEMALRNLKKLCDAGVLVALGTDSGAFPPRAQGFSEHLEMQLMVSAGLTPLQAITVATRDAARAMKLTDQGTLSAGMRADFIVLNSNPAENIRATHSIQSVWKKGVQVSNGPLAK
jgi:imidazolonepropionase-like amidohydrolase